MLCDACFLFGSIVAEASKKIRTFKTGSRKSCTYSGVPRTIPGGGIISSASLPPGGIITYLPTYVLTLALRCKMSGWYNSWDSLTPRGWYSQKMGGISGYSTVPTIRSSAQSEARAVPEAPRHKWYRFLLESCRTLILTLKGINKNW